MVVDVRFPDGRQRLFQPEDLEEITSPRPWWHSLIQAAEEDYGELIQAHKNSLGRQNEEPVSS